jgi:hypothetical protein
VGDAPLERSANARIVTAECLANARIVTAERSANTRIVTAERSANTRIVTAECPAESHGSLPDQLVILQLGNLAADRHT